MMAVPGLDDDTSLLIEETDSGLEIFNEEAGLEEPNSVEEGQITPELIGVKEEPDPEPISVEDDTELPPEAPEEIKLEENTNDEIQIP